MQNRYLTDAGNLEWNRVQTLTTDMTDGYFSTLEGVEYAHGSGASDGLLGLFNDGDDVDADPDIIGSRLLKTLSQLHDVLMDYTIKNDDKEDVVYRLQKVTPLLTKMSDQYAMENQYYAEHWHDDVVDMATAINKQ